MKTNAGESFDRAERRTLHQQSDAYASLLNRQVHAIKRFVLRFNKGLEANGAVEALIAFAVFTALAGFILTGRTVHREPCLSLAIGSQCLLPETNVSNRVWFSMKAQVLSALEPLTCSNTRTSYLSAQELSRK